MYTERSTYFLQIRIIIYENTFVKIILFWRIWNWFMCFLFISERIILKYIFGTVRAVVLQNFISEAENEYVIRSNSVSTQCKIPSFISEFVYVDQWIMDDGTVYRLEDRDYGKIRITNSNTKLDNRLSQKSIIM